MHTARDASVRGWPVYIGPKCSRFARNRRTQPSIFFRSYVLQVKLGADLPRLSSADDQKPFPGVLACTSQRQHGSGNFNDSDLYDRYAFVSRLLHGEQSAKLAGAAQRLAWVPYGNALYLPLWMRGGHSEWWRLRRAQVLPPAAHLAPQQQPPVQTPMQSTQAMSVGDLPIAAAAAATELASRKAGDGIPGGNTCFQHPDAVRRLDSGPRGTSHDAMAMAKATAADGEARRPVASADDDLDLVDISISRTDVALPSTPPSERGATGRAAAAEFPVQGGVSSPHQLRSLPGGQGDIGDIPGANDREGGLVLGSVSRWVLAEGGASWVVRAPGSLRGEVWGNDRQQEQQQQKDQQQRRSLFMRGSDVPARPRQPQLLLSSQPPAPPPESSAGFPGDDVRKPSDPEPDPEPDPDPQQRQGLDPLVSVAEGAVQPSHASLWQQKQPLELLPPPPPQQQQQQQQLSRQGSPADQSTDGRQGTGSCPTEALRGLPMEGGFAAAQAGAASSQPHSPPPPFLHMGAAASPLPPPSPRKPLFVRGAAIPFRTPPAPQPVSADAGVTTRSPGPYCDSREGSDMSPQLPTVSPQQPPQQGPWQQQKQQLTWARSAAGGHPMPTDGSRGSSCDNRDGGWGSTSDLGEMDLASVSGSSCGSSCGSNTGSSTKGEEEKGDADGPPSPSAPPPPSQPLPLPTPPGRPLFVRGAAIPFRAPPSSAQATLPQSALLAGLNLSSQPQPLPQEQDPERQQRQLRWSLTAHPPQRPNQDTSRSANKRSGNDQSCQSASDASDDATPGSRSDSSSSSSSSRSQGLEFSRPVESARHIAHRDDSSSVQTAKSVTGDGSSSNSSSSSRNGTDAGGLLQPETAAAAAAAAAAAGTRFPAGFASAWQSYQALLQAQAQAGLQTGAHQGIQLSQPPPAQPPPAQQSSEPQPGPAPPPNQRLSPVRSFEGSPSDSSEAGAGNPGSQPTTANYRFVPLLPRENLEERRVIGGMRLAPEMPPIPPPALPSRTTSTTTITSTMTSTSTTTITSTTSATTQPARVQSQPSQHQRQRVMPPYMVGEVPTPGQDESQSNAQTLEFADFSQSPLMGATAAATAATATAGPTASGLPKTISTATAAAATAAAFVPYGLAASGKPGEGAEAAPSRGTGAISVPVAREAVAAVAAFSSGKEVSARRARGRLYAWELSVSCFRADMDPRGRVLSWACVCTLPGGDLPLPDAVLAAEQQLLRLQGEWKIPGGTAHGLTEHGATSIASAAAALVAARSASGVDVTAAAAEVAMRRVSLEALAAASPSAAQRGRLLQLARRGRLRGLDPAVFHALCPGGGVAAAGAESPLRSVGVESYASTEMVSTSSSVSMPSFSSSPSSSTSTYSVDGEDKLKKRGGGGGDGRGAIATVDKGAGGSTTVSAGLLLHHVLAVQGLEEAEENAEEARAAAAAAAAGLPPPISRRQLGLVRSFLRRAARGVETDAGPWLRSVFVGAVPERRLRRLVAELVGEEYGGSSVEYGLTPYRYRGAAAAPPRAPEAALEELLGLLTRGSAGEVIERLKRHVDGLHRRE